MDTFIYTGDQRVTVDLYGLGYRCLHEPASRHLDGKIYCAVHKISNPLINDRLVHARANGEVLGAWPRRRARLEKPLPSLPS